MKFDFDPLHCRFHVSFLIKENKVAVRICNETKMPLIEPLATKKKEKESMDEMGKFQVVMNMVGISVGAL